MSLVESLLGGPPQEGQTHQLGGDRYVFSDGILRQRALVTDAQGQTRDAFGFKWQIREHYESKALQSFSADWLVERYLDGDAAKLDGLLRDGAKVLDAGCGAGYSALLLLDAHLDRIQYLGVDISAAIDVAKRRFDEAGRRAELMQADFTQLPFEAGTFDAILAEGTLHHTDSTKGALDALAGLLAQGGHFLFYVYRTKGAVREFTDDMIRAKLASMSDQEAWDALMPLTELGRALGQLDAQVELPTDVPMLGLEAGEIDVQRLFYWGVAKAFYRPDLTVEEMNLINFDWYRPTNAHRQSPEEVRRWCDDAGLDIVRERVEPAGISIVARKR